ncbi:MAG TPA: response regulator transcription factor [Rubrobacteraceae bacterium]|nr:response regulator transcription factor [Rubrobacteraceae bacterium]
METESAAAKLMAGKKQDSLEGRQGERRRASSLVCKRGMQSAHTSEDHYRARRRARSHLEVVDAQPERAEADPVISLAQTGRARDEREPSGLIWLRCELPCSVVTLGLKLALEKARTQQVYTGPSRPKTAPSSIILCTNGVATASEGVKELRDLYPDSSILVFGVYADLSLAKVALRSGARGFMHTGMSAQQIVRAVEVAAKGELVLPRALLEAFILNEEQVELGALSIRQGEVVGLVVEALTNAQIAKRLHLAESTVKQHLRASYKILGVSNRTEAMNLLRTSHA